MTRILRNSILFAAAMVVPACAPTPKPAPGIKVVYRDVYHETQRPCPVTVPQRPAKLAQPLPLSPARLIDLLTAKLAEWAGEGKYGDKADEALRTCTKKD